MTSLPIITYECDQCGACCKFGIVEIQDFDVLREPKIKDLYHPFKKDPHVESYDEIDEETGENLGPLVPGWEAGAMLCPTRKPDGGIGHCHFLTAENKCDIYSTRPHICLTFRAGSDQCQMYREYAELPPLQPKESFS